MMSDERAMIDLRYIKSGCARMRVLDFGDDDDAVRERMALHAEWDDAIWQLPQIVAAYEGGVLSDATVAELRSVAQEVTALLPEIERIRFRLPDQAALARAMQAAVVRTA
jgi:predicted PP-loop superfamily ATPase